MKKRVLIKLGGSSLDNELTLKEVAGVLHGYLKKGFDIAVIHGGGVELKEELKKRGHEPRYIQGQKQVTPAAMEVIAEVLDKEVHGHVLQNLTDSGFLVQPLSGAADQIFKCSALQDNLMQAGDIKCVDTIKILKAWGEGKIPVVSALGCDDNGDLFSLKADWAATELAVELHADELVFLTDQEGILGPDHRRMREVHSVDVDQMIEDGVISGGMHTKIQSMLYGFEHGIKEVRLLNSFKASEMHEVPSMGTRISQ